MTDEELMAGFEDASLTEFHHADHVRLSWLYLTRYPLLEALMRVSQGLRRFAAAKGKPERYHETITWAYLFLIAERRADHDGANCSWPQFAAANRDLLDWQENVLKKYYRAETLASERARKTFLLPDRI